MIPEISFVVPVYNVEKYISQCIESVLSQEYKNLEIILVDDGSTDKSGAICDEYNDKYSFIRVVHKENGGLSDSRNVGIRNAHGKYVLFLDSDDYIEKSSLQTIIKSVEKYEKAPDIVFLEAVKIFPDGSSVPLDNCMDSGITDNRSKKEVISKIATLPKFPGSVCTKLIKRKFIIDNSLFFTKDLLSEDIDWTINALLKADSFGYCGCRYYYYRQNRQGSITNRAGINSVNSLLYIIEKWADNGSDYKDDINSILAYEYMILLFNCAKLEKADKQKVKDKIRKYRYLMNYARTKKIKLVSLSCKLIGLDLTSDLLNLAYKLK